MAHDDVPEPIPPISDTDEGERSTAGASPRPPRESPLLLTIGIILFAGLIAMSWVRTGERAKKPDTTPDTLSAIYATYAVTALLSWQARDVVPEAAGLSQAITQMAQQGAEAWTASAKGATGRNAANAYVNAAALAGVAENAADARADLEKAIAVDGARTQAYLEILGLYQKPPIVLEFSPDTQTILDNLAAGSLINARYAQLRDAGPAAVQAALRPGAQAGMRALLIFGAIGLGMVGVLTVAIILWGYYFSTHRGVGALVNEAAQTPPDIPPYAIGTALILISLTYLFSAVLGSTLTTITRAGEQNLNLRLIIGAIALIISAITVQGIYLAAIGRKAWDWQTFGWRPTRQGVGYGILALVLVIPIVWAATFVSDRLIRLAGGSSEQHPLVPLILDAKNVWFLLFAFILATIVAPLVEETLFRGMLFRALDARLSMWTSVLLSGLLFSIIHGQLVAVIPITLLGALFALLTRRTGSLYASAGAHAAFNSFASLMAILVSWALRGPGS